MRFNTLGKYARTEGRAGREASHSLSIVSTAQSEQEIKAGVVVVVCTKSRAGQEYQILTFYNFMGH